MEPVRRDGESCYYSVLGICKQASDAEIRGAYRKLALIWHPDRCIKDPAIVGLATHKFQQIQEAYSVLSNKGKRLIYDAGLLHLLADESDDKGFCEFMQEMVAMMEKEKSQAASSLEQLQSMLQEMMEGADQLFQESQQTAGRTRRKRHI